MFIYVQNYRAYEAAGINFNRSESVLISEIEEIKCVFIATTPINSLLKYCSNSCCWKHAFREGELRRITVSVAQVSETILELRGSLRCRVRNK